MAGAGRYRNKSDEEIQALVSPVKDTTKEFVLLDEESAKPAARETDKHRLQQRLKQIEYGKNTLGYQNYIKSVPKHRRRVLHDKVALDPQTPDVHQVCSKRAFDGQVRRWRQALHDFDPHSHSAKGENGRRSGRSGKAAEEPAKPSASMEDSDGPPGFPPLRKQTDNEANLGERPGPTSPVNARGKGKRSYQNTDLAMDIGSPLGNSTKSRRGDQQTDVGQGDRGDEARSIYDAWDEDANLL